MKKYKVFVRQGSHGFAIFLVFAFFMVCAKKQGRNIICHISIPFWSLFDEAERSQFWWNIPHKINLFMLEISSNSVSKNHKYYKIEIIP